MLLTAEAIAVRATELNPGRTVTVAGTKIAVLLEAAETAAPPGGAGPERAMVQKAKPPPVTVGAHVIEDRELPILIRAVAVTPPNVA